MGRALAVAVEFEQSCYSLAQVASLTFETSAPGRTLFEDEAFVRRLFDRVHKKHLAGRIAEVTKLQPPQNLRDALDDGRKARNELVHELLVGHGALVHTAGWTSLIMERLRAITHRIAFADSLAHAIFAVLLGHAAPESETIAGYPEKAVAWVVRGAAVNNSPAAGTAARAGELR